MKTDKGSSISTLAFSKNFIDKTREVFEPLCHKSLSDDECAEIANNIIELELLLREVAKNEKN